MQQFSQFSLESDFKTTTFLIIRNTTEEDINAKLLSFQVLLQLGSSVSLRLVFSEGHFL